MLYILYSKYLMKYLNEFFIDFCCVDMSKNPYRSRLGKEIMTSSTRREGWRRTLCLRREGVCRRWFVLHMTSTMWLRSRCTILSSNITMMILIIISTSRSMTRRFNLSSMRPRQPHHDSMPFLEGLKIYLCCPHPRITLLSRSGMTVMK